MNARKWGVGSAAASKRGRSYVTRDGRVARDVPLRRRVPGGFVGLGLRAQCKKRGRTWNVFSARGRHAGRVERVRGMEGGGQHVARRILCEARGAFDARTPAGIARGTRSSNGLNIPANEVPPRQRSGPSNTSTSSPRSFTAYVSTMDVIAADPHSRLARDLLDHACCAAPLRASCVRLERRRAKTRRRDSSFLFRNRGCR